MEVIHRYAASLRVASAVYVQDRIDPPAGGRIVDVAGWAAEAERAEDRLVWLFTLLLMVSQPATGRSRWRTRC
ncbi:hypothetical protein AB0M91_24000 [Micromonospora rifamycinica]|uniref:hypothetical protein n=2 Tax=Micromonospora rifamycinica TaxID=291594 RepID=UPI0034411371